MIYFIFGALRYSIRHFNTRIDTRSHPLASREISNVVSSNEMAENIGNNANNKGVITQLWRPTAYAPRAPSFQCAHSYFVITSTKPLYGFVY